jgi:hypothetical protein
MRKVLIALAAGLLAAVAATSAAAASSLPVVYNSLN